MQFAELFKSLCKEHGVSQLQALADLGLARTAPQSWKKGKPSLETAKKIADYFGVSVDSLLTGDSAPSQEAAAPLSEIDREIMRIVQGLDLRRKNAVLTFLYELEDKQPPF